MSDKKLVEKIVMFRNELDRQNAGMGIRSLFDTICSYYGEQHRTIESQKEEIEDIKRHQGEYIASLEFEVESLKVITEIALKGFEEIASNIHTNHVMAMKAKLALGRIERIQNE